MRLALFDALYDCHGLKFFVESSEYEMSKELLHVIYMSRPKICKLFNYLNRKCNSLKNLSNL